MIRNDAIEFLDETWRPPSGGDRGRSSGKTIPSVLGAAIALSGKRGRSAKAKLGQITARVPEVMVKVSGRQRGGTHTLAHLAYISRHGKLAVETSDGERISGAGDLAEIAAEWAEDEQRTSKRREPLTSVSLVLSMPTGNDAETVRDAARAFGRVELEAFPYVMALHTDTDHPHVHVTVAARGESGVRFNPRKQDLARWRETFARELRARGIAAEATPRRARGVIRRPDHLAVRKIRDRAKAGSQAEPVVLQASGQQAERLAAEQPPKPREWEVRIAARQAKIRADYRKAADALSKGNAEERALARQTLDFVETMPGPATRDRAKAIAIAKGKRGRAYPAKGERDR